MKTEEQVKNAIKWIDELLMTTEKQGTMFLGNSDRGFCYIGLGCYIFELNYEDSDRYSSEFKHKVGLYHTNGEPLGAYGHQSLVYTNDVLGWSFSKIGEHLKKFPEQYFTPKVALGIMKHYLEVPA